MISVWGMSHVVAKESFARLGSRTGDLSPTAFAYSFALARSRFARPWLCSAAATRLVNSNTHLRYALLAARCLDFHFKTRARRNESGDLHC
jgi:hypothetical protein